MPNKRKTPNAFSLFSSDWKKEHENELNTTNKSEAEVMKECEYAWKNNPEKQNYYRQSVVQVKGKSKLNVEFKYTSINETYQSKKVDRKEAQDFIDKMILEIKTTISDLSSHCLETLVNHRFFFIHANYYIEWMKEHKYIPCEVAIAEYSVLEGVHDVIHFFPGVDTPDGKLPMGYASEAKEKADASHRIPPPPFEPAESDFHELSSKVLNFLTKNGATAVPPVYTMNDDIYHNYSRSTVCDFMDLIRDFSGETIRVYRLPLLLNELHNACSTFGCGTNEPLSVTDCKRGLDIDPFLYVQGIACVYHSLVESDAFRFCSKSTVQRWAFIFSKFCCTVVGYKLQPGKHCPLKSKEETVTIQKGTFSRRDISVNPEKRESSSLVKSPIGDKLDEPLFQRWKPDLSSAPIYKVGQHSGVVSEIRRDETCKYVEGTGVRLPKTRGKADVLVNRQKNADLRGFTKDEFPVLGNPIATPAQWQRHLVKTEPFTSTKMDFPSLAGPSSGKK